MQPGREEFYQTESRKGLRPQPAAFNLRGLSGIASGHGVVASMEVELDGIDGRDGCESIGHGLEVGRGAGGAHLLGELPVIADMDIGRIFFDFLQHGLGKFGLLEQIVQRADQLLR